MPPFCPNAIRVKTILSLAGDQQGLKEPVSASRESLVNPVPSGLTTKMLVLLTRSSESLNAIFEPSGDQSDSPAFIPQGVSCLKLLPSTLTTKTAVWPPPRSNFFARVNVIWLPSGEYCGSPSNN